MLISPHSRWLVRYEVKFRPQRDNGAALRLRAPKELDVIDVLTKAMKDGKARLSVSNNDVVKLTHVHVRKKEGMVVLLFRRSDPDASTPVFEHQKSGTLRDSDKTVEEAEAVSAHLFVSLDEKQTPHPTYRAILEEVPGLGRTYIQAIVREVLRETEYEYEDAKGAKRNTYTIPDFGGVPSQSVGNSLKPGAGGGINYVELVREPDLGGLDLAGLMPHPQRMRLSLKADQQGDLSLVQRVKDWATGQKWQQVRVQVETGGRTKVVDIAKDADAADALFVKSEFVTTKKALRQCTDDISQELVEIARNLLVSNDGWK